MRGGVVVEREEMKDTRTGVAFYIKNNMENCVLYIISSYIFLPSAKITARSSNIVCRHQCVY